MKLLINSNINMHLVQGVLLASFNFQSTFLRMTPNLEGVSRIMYIVEQWLFVSFMDCICVAIQS